MKARKGLVLFANALVLAFACLFVAEGLVFVSQLMARPPLEGLENQLIDLAFGVRKENSFHRRVTADSIVIIDIDDASIERLGRAQLWPRAYDAHTIRYIASGHPHSIGIDLLYTETDSLLPAYSEMLSEKGFNHSDSIINALSTDHELSASIAEAGNVYLSFFDDDAKSSSLFNPESLNGLRLFKGTTETREILKLNYPVLPIKEFLYGGRATGAISMPADQGGAIRYYQLIKRVPGDSSLFRFAANFPFYMLIDKIGISDNDVIVQKNSIRLGDKMTIPLNKDGAFRINWLGNNEKIRHISFYKVLGELIPPEFFENKYIFFGASASGLQDLKTIPSTAEKTPGVDVHAVAFLNMINGRFLHEVSERDALPYFSVLSLLLIMLFLLLRPLFGFLVSIALVFGEVFSFVLFIFPRYSLVFPIVTLMLLTFLSYIIASLYSYFVSEKKSRRLKNAFSSYVSPAIVNQIIRNASALNLGGEKKHLTVLFSDIRGFTSFSEQLDPQELVAVLNDYLSQMSEVIFKHNGTIDKFIGDAIMAFFGAPVSLKNHADNACHVALDMMVCLKKVNAHLMERGQPPLAIGIGLNSGDMTVGNIGSRRRFDYTVIGDAVNIGSRLEGMTKFFGVGIIVSETTKKESSPGEFLFRELGSVKVKGKEKPVDIFQLVAVNGNAPDTENLIRSWTTAFDALQRKDLKQASAIFKEYLEQWPGDIPATYYIRQCEKFAGREEEFNLIITMESK
ncbi:MAG: adenylate/guanylate cyclase domain-containing protein [Crocinitomicaceae bacterium]|nr:adenylate/guanylate cyclase domain-containing protein [Crocinitomicaceae bacterium]